MEDRGGALTRFLRCWIDGGRDFALLLGVFDNPDLGSVAKALFSCSSRASRNVVDYKDRISNAPKSHFDVLPHPSPHLVALETHFSQAPPSLDLCFRSKRMFQYCCSSIGR